MLTIGDKIEGFHLPRDGGDQVSMADIQSDKFVLFFYPRDLTSGCTTEAKEFSAAKPAFLAHGAEIFGVSTDPVASHDKFVAKAELTIPLLSDEDAELASMFGVWKEKKMYGKTFMGIERASFILSGGGEILAEWRKVKVPGHVADVLAKLKTL